MIGLAIITASALILMFIKVWEHRYTGSAEWEVDQIADTQPPFDTMISFWMNIGRIGLIILLVEILIRL